MFCFQTSIGQKILIDSRINYQNQANIEDFKNKFSVWFSTQRKIDEDQDIFQINYNRSVIVRVSASAEGLQIYENKKLRKSINYEQLNQHIQWYHIIITQYEKQEHVVFDLNLYQLSMLYSSINIDNMHALKNQTKVFSKKNKYYFCLVYDSIIMDLSPIIQKVTFYTFIMPYTIEQLLYYNNSSAIIFLRKFQSQYQTCNLLSLFNGEYELFILFEHESNLYFAIGSNVDELGILQEKWFTVQIVVSIENIHVIIQTETDHKYEFPNIYDQIFYTIELYSAFSNVQHLQIISTFKSKLEDVNKQLFDLECQIDQFYDRDHQRCITLDQIYQFKLIQKDEIQIEQSHSVSYEYIENLILYKILMQLDIDDVQSTLFTNKYINLKEYNSEGEDVYVFWKNDYKIICQQFYFGNNCNSFVKKCILMNQNNCKYCIFGYINIQQKCKKCPKGCLICIFKNHQLLCLLSYHQYYINNIGLTQICNCEYCSYKGECLDIENVRRLIDNCEQDHQCLLRKCSSSTFYSIKSQKCISLSWETLIILFQYKNQIFLQDILQIQNLIIQSHLINQNNLSDNEILTKLYFGYQLFNKYNVLLEKDLSNKEYYFMNQYNLKCEEKGIDSVGDIVCQKYQQIDGNIQSQYNLELHATLYMNNHINFILYQQEQYLTFIDCFKQILDIGIQYTNIIIYLNITFDQSVLNQRHGYQIFIDRTQLPNHISSADFHFFLQFPEIKDESIFVNLLLIIDYLYIIDCNLGFNLDLSIDSGNLVNLKNFTMTEQIEFKFFIKNLAFVKMIDVMLNSTFLLSILQLKDLELINSNFDLQSENSVIMIGSLNNFIVTNCQFKIVDLQIKKLIQIKISNNIILQDVTIYSFNVSNSYFITIESSQNIIIKNFFVNAINLTNSKILKIQNTLYTIIDGLKSVIQNSSKIGCYEIQSYQLELQNSDLYALEVQLANFFSIVSQEVKIKKIIFIIEISNYNVILIINTKMLIMDDFSLKQAQNQTAFGDKPEGLYNYSIKLTIDYGSIQNFKFSGIRLRNFGLLNFQVSQQILINNFYLEKIDFFQNSPQHLLLFQEYQNYPLYYITNLTITNVSLVIPNNNILINMNNIQQINIINIQISYIYTFSIDGYILSVDSVQIRIENITVFNCNGINFMDTQSTINFLWYLNFKNNQEMKIFNINSLMIRVFLIYHTLISFHQGEILEALEQQDPYFTLKIKLKNITIYQIRSIITIFNIFFIHGLSTNFRIDDFIIQHQNFEQLALNDVPIFQIQCQNFYAQNLIIDNIKQPLFQILEAKQMLLSQIQIQNIQTDLNYLALIHSSIIIIENLKLQNIKNCFAIIIISGNTETTYFNNLKLLKLYNISMVVSYTQEKKQFLKIQNTILIQFDLQYLFAFILRRSEFINVENLFSNQGKYLLLEGYKNKVCFINSFLSNVTFEIKHSDQIILKSSEVIGNHLQYTNQFELKYSQIYDSINLQAYNRMSFFMTLSFDGGKNLQQVQQLNQQLNEKLQFQIKFAQQNITFFYVPSGQKLSSYKRLNFKQLSNEQIYQGLSLVIKGYTIEPNNQNICYQQQYFNDELIQDQTNVLQNFTISEEQYNIDQIFKINPYNKNYTVFKIDCQFKNKNISLQYNVKAFPCQLGEYFFKNQCLLCNISQYQYSVTYNATKCQYIDFIKIKTVKPGLIQLQQNYWRYKYDSHIIEFCDSQNCNGGWIPGIQSCAKSRIGALCNECDLYNIRGDGKYTKNNGECLQCQDLNIKFVLEFLLVVIIQQLFALLAYYSNNNISNQYLIYKIGFQQFYQILYRQSVDQTSIIIKMYTNYIFMLYIIRQNFDIIGKLFIININFMNNPSLIFQAQLACILSGLTQLNIIYAQFFYEIFLPLFILSVTFTIYLIAIQVKTKNFQIGFIIFLLDNIFVYNLKIIIETATNLLSYSQISQQKWITLNLEYLFYSDTHMQMIKYIIPLTVTILLFPLFFPFLSRNLNILSRRAIRIFSIYFQEYKPRLFYWEYCIIYTKFLMMILQIYDKQSNYSKILIIILILQSSYNLKPYYLQNLNSFEYNLFIYYTLQLISQILGDYISVLIIGINLYIFLQFLIRLKKSYFLLHMNQIIIYQEKIVKIIPRLSNIIGIQENQRQLTKTKVMKKKQIVKKPINHYHLQTEIELECFKQTISRVNPSRQE